MRDFKLTLEQLRERSQNAYNNHSNKYYEFSDGWKSTSNTNPTRGMIFQDINPSQSPTVQFKDEMGKVRTGFLASFTYESDGDQILCDVMYVGADFPRTMSLKSLTVIDGQMPAVPSKPTFN